MSVQIYESNVIYTKCTLNVVTPVGELLELQPVSWRERDGIKIHRL